MLEQAGTVDSKKTPRTEGGDKVPAGLPLPVPEILEFVALCDSGKIFQLFSRDFPGVFLENPRTDPGNSHSLLELSDLSRSYKTKAYEQITDRKGKITPKTEKNLRR